MRIERPQHAGHRRLISVVVIEFVAVDVVVANDVQGVLEVLIDRGDCGCRRPRPRPAVGRRRQLASPCSSARGLVRPLLSKNKNGE